MKKLSFKLMIAFVAGLVGFTACNTEDVEPNVAQISIGGDGSNVVNLPKEAGSYDLQVFSNRAWKIESVTADVEWLVFTPASGEGNGTVRFTYAPNPDVKHEATIRISTSTAKVDVRFIQAGAIETTDLYYESFGSSPTGTQSVASYTGWAKIGLGASTVTYEGTELRDNLASTGYPAASGGQAAYFAAGGGSKFTIKSIGLFGLTSFDLSFGWTDGAVKPSAVEYSIDGGTTWTAITATGAYASGWGLMTAQFTIPSPATYLWLRFTAGAYTYGSRLDDVKLVGRGTATLPDVTVTTGAAGSITKNTAAISGNTYTINNSVTITELGVAYAVSGSSTFTHTAAPSASVTPYSVTLGNPTALTAGTVYQFKAYALIGSTYYYGSVGTFTTESGDVIFADNFGTGAPSATPFTALNAWTAWAMTGTGAAGVTYTKDGTGVVDVRSNSPSNTNNDPAYAGSGANNVFLPKDGGDSFIINGIGVTGTTQFTLSFGYSASDAAKPSAFYATAATGPWMPMTITGTFGTYRWVQFKGSFAITASPKVWIKITSASYEFGSRIDDVKLTAGATTPIVTPPTVTTGAVASIGDTGATFNGTYTAGSETVSNTGFALKKGAETYQEFLTGSGTSPFTLAKTGLVAGTEYTIKAFVVTPSGKSYGSEATFTTTGGGIQPGTNSLINGSFEDWTAADPATWVKNGAATLTKVTINPKDGVNALKLESVGSGTKGFKQDVSVTPEDTYGVSFWYRETSAGSGSTGLKLWIVFRNGSNEIINNDQVEVISGYGPQSEALNNQTTTWQNYGTVFKVPANAATLTFEIRATANQFGTIDKCELIKQGGGSTVQPTVTMDNVASGTITASSALVSGSYTGGNQTVSAVGFEYKTGVGIWNEQTATLGATYSATISSLTASTTYSVRAFATTPAGKQYSTEKTFTTAASGVTPPTVTTAAATTLANTSAMLNGSYTAGSESVTAVGFEIKSGAGSYADAGAVTLGATFSLSKTGLTAATTYTYKAWAQTASGKTYGSEQTFTTTGGSTNLLTNADFNTWTTSTAAPDNWTYSSPASVFSQVTGRTGYAVKIDVPSTGATGNCSQKINVTPGTNYTITVWYKDNTKGNATAGSRCWGVFRDSADLIINNNTVTVVSGGTKGVQPDCFDAVAVWTQYTTTVTAPANATTFTLDVRATKGYTGTYDDCEVKVAP